MVSPSPTAIYSRRSLWFRVLNDELPSSHITDLALPGVGLLETVLTLAVVRDSLFDFVAGGHDEWPILVNGLI